MNKLTIFFIAFLFCACRTIESTKSVYHEDIVNSISIEISDRLQRHFNTIATNSKVKTPSFENVDSVTKSIGYYLFDQLVENSEKNKTSEVQTMVDSIAYPYLLFSEIILDASESYCMVSYVKYYGPIAAEEVCAIYRIEKTSGKSLSVNLLWSQSLWVS